MKTYACGNCEYWYDPSPNVRSWCIRCVDAQGNQIGDAHYVGTQADRDYAIAEILQRMDLTPRYQGEACVLVSTRFTSAAGYKHKLGQAGTLLAIEEDWARARFPGLPTVRLPLNDLRKV